MKKIYAVRDVIVEKFNFPFISHNDATARRSFEQTIFDNISDSVVKDLELYAVGEFDDETCKVTMFDIPLLLARGIDYVEKNK